MARRDAARFPAIGEAGRRTGARAGAALRRPPRRASSPGAYSAFVNLMKFVLPVAAVGLIALVTLWAELNKDDFAVPDGLDAISLRDAENLRMVNPRFFGRDAAGRPYTVTADEAFQDRPGDDLLRLLSPRADVTTETDNWVSLGAASGVYNQQSRMLALDGAVNLFHDDGYEFHTDSARIDLDAGSAEGNAPVRGHGPFGEIEAAGFRVRDGGSVIEFTGAATLVLRPGRAGMGQ